MAAGALVNDYARRSGYAVASLIARAAECDALAAETPSATARDLLRRIAAGLREDAERAEAA